MYSLRMLGGLSLEGDDGPVTGAAVQRHRLALLALLAIARPQGVPREKLLAYLWPERTEESARNLLNQAVHALRGRLRKDAILSSGDELRLDDRLLPSDVSGFEAALAAGDDARAVELYAGPFLDGFFLPQAKEFEGWVEMERGRIAAEYAAALERLAEAAESEGRLAAAVGWWRRAAAADPFSSRIALRFMRALAAGGDRGSALDHLRVHEQLLEEEFGAALDPELVAFADALRKGTATMRPSVAQPEIPEPEPTAGGGPEMAPANEDGEGDHRLSEGVAGLAPGSGEGTPAVPGRRRRRDGAVAGVLAAAIGVVVLFLTLGPGQPLDGGPGHASPAPTVAVLPFTDMSDQDQAYFADGVTEEILLHLARVPELRVISRTSVTRFRDADRGLRDIGRELGATHILEGSIRHTGDRVRISAQLIDARTDHHLWADAFDRDIEDIIEVQSEISSEIVRALRTELPGAELPEAAFATAPTHDVEAYQLYLRGRYLYHNYIRLADELPLSRAVDYFDRALERDPDFARALAAKGAAYALMSITMYHPPVDFEATAASALAATRRALELDPGLAEAHTALAQVRMSRLEWAAAERSLLRAIEAEPENAASYLHYGMLLVAVGRSEAAVEVLFRAVELDPLNAVTAHWLADALRNTGRLEASRAEAARSVDLGMASAGMGVYIYHLLREEWEEAASYQESLAETQGFDPGWVRPMVEAVRDPARIPAAVELTETAARDEPAFVPVWFYFDLEAPDLVFDGMQGLIDDGRSVTALWRVWEPQLTRLRNHPRFQEVAEGAGLTAYWREVVWPDQCAPENGGFTCR